ncbi:MAG: response regulator [Bdellovibrionales bacterium]|nr:response regulator [Bdellovibrionales bacterium]
MSSSKSQQPLSRSAAAILVVIRSNHINNQLRMALKTLGFAKLTSVAAHSAGLERLKSLSFGRKYDFVLYDAKDTDMPAVEFVQKAVETEPDSILIAASAEPRIDDVFGQLRAGARGFLVLPFTPESLEQVVFRAMEGPPFSESVLRAPDRNAALVGCVLNNLYRLSVLMRQIRQYPHVGKDLPRYRRAFSESMDLALTFCEAGKEHELREKILEECVARANAAASRLGRTRLKLNKERAKKGG